MPSTQAAAVRLVIQFINGGKSVEYRVIVYPARKGLRLQPATFATRTELLTRLASAMPSFNQRLLALEDAPPQIIFSGWLDATDDQLIALGVARYA